MNKVLLSLLAFALLAVFFVSTNIVSNNMLQGWRIDLTKEKLYTLSDGTKKIIENIDEPITLRLYYSVALANDIPTFRTYAARVRELIEEFASYSNGKIRLEIVDPKPFTDEEDDAVRYGMQGVQVTDTDKLYFGLVGFNLTDDQESVPFFQQEKESFLEYELTRLIHNLSDPKKPVIGLVTGHQMNAGVSPMMRLNPNAPRPWAILEQIRETMELKDLGTSFESIEPGVDVLLIVHPPELKPATLYAIDQFVMNGGKVIAYLDPMSELGSSQLRAAQGRPVQTPVSSNLEPLLAAWGAKMHEDKVVGDWSIARQVNVGQYGRVEIVRYLPWLKLEAENYNTDDIVTSQLGNVMFAAAGAFEPLEGATTQFLPLIQSTENAMLLKAEDIKFGPDPKTLISNFEADGIRHVVAASITGPAKSAFPDGPPTTEPKDEDDKISPGSDKDAKKTDKTDKVEHIAEAKAPLNIILVSDGDSLYDNFWLQSREIGGQSVYIPTAANGSLLMNALDNLAGSSELINLRSRQRSDRPFRVVETLRRQAEQKFLNQEDELNKKLEDTLKKISNLQSKAQAEGGALLSEQQQAAIDEARQEVIGTRKQLRDVQANLNADIEQLESRVKLINIAAVPLLFTLLAIIVAALRLRRRRKAHEFARA